MTTTMTHDEVVEMLRSAIADEGLTLARFFELGMEDALVVPELRDLCLIWRSEITEPDLH